jgi:aryl-alcohol dehydrogenase-like predicted oxidoreductase
VQAGARSVNRSPLAMGLLAGRYADNTRFDAQALGVDLGTQSRDGPIPGIRTVTQAEDNAAALANGPLTGERLSHIEQLPCNAHVATCTAPGAGSAYGAGAYDGVAGPGSRPVPCS